MRRRGCKPPALAGHARGTARRVRGESKIGARSLKTKGGRAVGAGMGGTEDAKTTQRTPRIHLGAAACADLEEYARERLPERSSLPAKARALSDAFDLADPIAAIALWTRLGRLARAIRAATGRSAGVDDGRSKG
jgi:hypothetical protein